MSKFFIKWGVVVSYISVLIVNFLANTLPINSMTTGDISDLYPNLFTPAGLTFSIWGLIYILLLGYVLYQLGVLQKSKKEKIEKLFQKVGIYFIISSVANICWIFAWHYTLPAFSVVVMIVLLLSLIKINDAIKEERLVSKKEKLFIVLPFSIYFGWITVATIANVTAFLVSLGWDGFGVGEDVWTVAILTVGAVIGALRMHKDKSVAYGAVFIWAYFGVWLKHTSASGFRGDYPVIIFTAVACIVFLITVMAKIIFKEKLLERK